MSVTSYDLDQSVFITTFSKRRVRLHEIHPEDFVIEDIAHALSLQCRFTGHLRRFYSVAQHCITASELAPVGFKLEALLHDAAEAYLADVARPIKNLPGMDGYIRLDKAIDQAIRAQFGLPLDMTPEVKAVDNQLLCTEARQLLPDHEWTDGLPFFQVSLSTLTPEQAENVFLQKFHALAP